MEVGLEERCQDEGDDERHAWPAVGLHPVAEDAEANREHEIFGTPPERQSRQNHEHGDDRNEDLGGDHREPGKLSRCGKAENRGKPVGEK